MWKTISGNWLVFILIAGALCVISFTALSLLRLFRAYRTLNEQQEASMKISFSRFLYYSFSGAWADYLQAYNRLTKKDYELQNSLDRAKFRNLQSQINPHFLYNTLETIRGLALLEGADQVASMASALGKYFRYNISFKVDVVSIGDEINNIRNYFLIQQYRFSDRFQLVLDFDEEDEDIMGYPLPKMTIQPLVENAIFHGLEKVMRGGRVTIRIVREDSMLSIHVIDNGAGIPAKLMHEINASLYTNREMTTADQPQESNRVGLLNINQRICALYGSRYGLRLTSMENVGTDVEITMPYPPNNDETVRRLQQPEPDGRGQG